MRRPRYKRCDFCGRNDHKVAVRGASGEVRGYCPSCWGADDDWRSTAECGARDQSGVLRGDARQATILYDNRKRKIGY